MALPKNMMIYLAERQMQIYDADNIGYCEALVTCSRPRYIMLCAYGSLVRLGKITPIENCLLEDKETAWQTAKEIAKGRLGLKALIELVHVLLVIEYFLNS